MTNHVSRDEAGTPPGSAPPATHTSVAARVHDAARRRPPEPPGKGLAMAVIAGLAVIAAILQFTVFKSTGGAAGVRVAREAEQRQPRLAPERPPEAGAPAGPAPSLPMPGPQPPPTEASPSGPLPREPGAPVPESLSPSVAGRLELALSVLEQPRRLATVGVNELASILADAPARDREVLRPFVLDRLAELIRGPRLRTPALDAALRVASVDASGLASLRAATLDVALADDEAAPAAIVFLDALADDAHAAAADALVRLAGDAVRPLHLRVLAGRTLAHWGLAADARHRIATAADTPAVLARALSPE